MPPATALVSPEAQPALVALLQHYGHSVIKISPSSALNPPLNMHPDLRFAAIDGRVFCSSDISDDFLAAAGINATRLDVLPRHGYPYDAPMNLVYTPDYAICNPCTIHPRLLQALRDSQVPFIAVKQGYTRCAVLPLPGRAIITADAGIAGRARTHKLDCLLIRPGSVRLEGFGYGFIGGCGGVDGNNIFFNGDPDRHPDGRLIREFLETKGFTLHSTPGLLADIGSILFL